MGFKAPVNQLTSRWLVLLRLKDVIQNPVNAYSLGTCTLYLVITWLNYRTWMGLVGPDSMAPGPQAGLHLPASRSGLKQTASTTNLGPTTNRGARGLSALAVADKGPGKMSLIHNFSHRSCLH